MPARKKKAVRERAAAANMTLGLVAASRLNRGNTIYYYALDPNTNNCARPVVISRRKELRNAHNYELTVLCDVNVTLPTGGRSFSAHVAEIRRKGSR